MTPDERKPDAVVDLLSGTGTGPLWGMASRDLNATLLAWPPGHEVAEHVNTEVDVLLVVLGGGGVVVVDQRRHVLAPGHVLLVEKGSSRTIRAGADGLRYLSVHKRRGPLTVAPRPAMWPLLVVVTKRRFPERSGVARTRLGRGARPDRERDQARPSNRAENRNRGFRRSTWENELE